MNALIQRPSRFARLPSLLVAISWSLSGCTLHNDVNYKIAHRYGVAEPEFFRVMGSLLGPPLVPGNACVTLQNGDEIFPAMLGAIRSAQKSVDFETFIYWSGEIGQKFADAFSERARAGVKIHVLMDWFGSDRISPSILRQLQEAGVAVRIFHPLNLLDPARMLAINNRTHRKLLVIDGAIGFTGGVGIADTWNGHAQDPDHWRDNHYRVEGPVVADLQAAFLDNWMATTGEVLVGNDYFPPLPNTGNYLGQVFKSSSQGGSESMQLMMLLSIAAAEKNIRLESAYFVPDAITRQAILAARKRGVTVEIIVPGKYIDEKIVRRASHSVWGDLLKDGVVIMEYQTTMFHCKQLIIDDRWVSIGSSNFDNRSFKLNDEANLNILDVTFAAGQIKIFENDKKSSHVYSYEHWKNRPAGEKFSEFLSSLLAWEL